MGIKRLLGYAQQKQRVRRNPLPTQQHSEERVKQLLAKSSGIYGYTHMQLRMAWFMLSGVHAFKHDAFCLNDNSPCVPCCIKFLHDDTSVWLF